MNKPKTIKQLIKRLKTFNPRLKKDFLKAGIPLTDLESGVFRRAYTINKLPVVIKIPRWKNQAHSLAEITNFKIARKKGTQKSTGTCQKFITQTRILVL